MQSPLPARLSKPVQELIQLAAEFFFHPVGVEVDTLLFGYQLQTSKRFDYGLPHYLRDGRPLRRRGRKHADTDSQRKAYLRATSAMFVALDSFNQVVVCLRI